MFYWDKLFQLQPVWVDMVDVSQFNSKPFQPFQLKMFFPNRTQKDPTNLDLPQVDLCLILNMFKSGLTKQVASIVLTSQLNKVKTCLIKMLAKWLGISLHKVTAKRNQQTR